MIGVRLNGGLGNCFFQLATAAALAEAAGEPWAGYGTMPYAEWFPRLRGRILPVSVVGGPTLYFKEPHYAFVPPVLSAWTELDTTLDGYFQSWRYFAHAQARVRELLTPYPVVRRVWPWVVLHVRRGDYLTKPDCHPVLPVAYYRAALEATGVPTRTVHAKIVNVVSDDPEWCRANLTPATLDGWTVRIEDGSVIDHLWTMMRARYLVIANSSFSWWGAYLAREDQQVYAPAPWFGPALPHDTSDLLPTEWEVVPWQA